MKDIELHRALTTRLYHEDILLAQRTYNYLTVNVFLGAILAVSIGSNGNIVKTFSVVIAILGVALSIIQLALGRRAERAILFWRKYIKLIEVKLNVQIDSSLFEFYQNAKVKTPYGTITAHEKVNVPMYKIFPWRVIPSTNVIVGIFLPWLICLFWTIAIFIFLPNAYIAILLTALFAMLTIITWFHIPAAPVIEEK